MRSTRSPGMGISHQWCHEQTQVDDAYTLNSQSHIGGVFLRIPHYQKYHIELLTVCRKFGNKM